MLSKFYMNHVQAVAWPNLMTNKYLSLVALKFLHVLEDESEMHQYFLHGRL